MYDCLIPTALDCLSDYRDGVLKMEYQIHAGTTGGTTSTARRSTTQNQPRQIPLACWLAGDSLTLSATGPVGFLSHNNNVLGYDASRVAGTAYYNKGRGAWKVK